MSISHAWLLLSDSALPLGSFAFSSALESYVAHQPKSTPARAQLGAFLQLTLRATACATLPFVAAAHAAPARAALLDDELDASTLCTVARRASTSQGRALLSVWEKSLAPAFPAAAAVDEYRRAVRAGGAAGHFGVAWGVVTAAAGLRVDDACYVFMFNHCKAVLSAGVRLGLVGPYQAQALLAQEATRAWVEAAVAEGRARPVAEVGQTAPVLDVYQGRHELLYSRVFNS